MDEKILAVFPTVKTAILECCDLGPEEVGLDSRLVADLGMESLDFIELIYELEQAFDITIPMGSLDVEIEEAMGGEPAEVDGVLTSAALAKLRAMVPGLADPDASEVSVEDVPLMITVRSVCGLLVLEQDRRLEEEGAS